MKCQHPDCDQVAIGTARLSVNNRPKEKMRLCQIHLDAAGDDRLPNVEECIAYVKSLGYDLIKRRRGLYIFRDNTGKRPPHNQEMWWNLNEMRHGVKYGC
jgi:hypothetical protein